MPALETWELARVREDVADLLPDTCNLLTVSYLADNQGGFSEVWGTASTNVPCRIDSIKPREQISTGRNVQFSQFMVSLPYNTTVTNTYRIETSSGSYNVIGVAAEKSWQAVKRVVVERLAE